MSYLGLTSPMTPQQTSEQAAIFNHFASIGAQSVENQAAQDAADARASAAQNAEAEQNQLTNQTRLKEIDAKNNAEVAGLLGKHLETLAAQYEGYRNPTYDEVTQAGAELGLQNVSQATNLIASQVAAGQTPNINGVTFPSLVPTYSAMETAKQGAALATTFSNIEKNQSTSDKNVATTQWDNAGRPYAASHFNPNVGRGRTGGTGGGSAQSGDPTSDAANGISALSDALGAANAYYQVASDPNQRDAKVKETAYNNYTKTKADLAGWHRLAVNNILSGHLGTLAQAALQQAVRGGAIPQADLYDVSKRDQVLSKINEMSNAQMPDGSNYVLPPAMRLGLRDSYNLLSGQTPQALTR